jgi:hypothetical protein
MYGMEQEFLPELGRLAVFTVNINMIDSSMKYIYSLAKLGTYITHHIHPLALPRAIYHAIFIQKIATFMVNRS